MYNRHARSYAHKLGLPSPNKVTLAYAAALVSFLLRTMIGETNKHAMSDELHPYYEKHTNNLNKMLQSDDEDKKSVLDEAYLLIQWGSGEKVRIIDTSADWWA